MNASGPGSSVRITSPLISLSLTTIARHQSTLKVIRHSMQTEGAAFMFKGWLPAWSRLQPTTILIFVTLEQLQGVVDWSRAKGFSL
jgi:hypothetical protein